MKQPSYWIIVHKEPATYNHDDKNSIFSNIFTWYIILVNKCWLNRRKCWVIKICKFETFEWCAIHDVLINLSLRNMNVNFFTVQFTKIYFKYETEKAFIGNYSINKSLILMVISDCATRLGLISLRRNPRSNHFCFEC